MTTGYQAILVEVEERLAVVTFNRPDKRNAIDHTMVNELHDVLDGFVMDGEVLPCVFTGAGDKAFVGGTDIAQLRERNALDALRTINAALFGKIEALPFPTIAAVRGYCLGGGCELAMCCDLRVAGEGAKFGQPEIALGIMLVLYLAKSLDLEYALVGELEAGRAVKGIAFCDHGKVRTDVRYALEGTPCENVVQGRLCCHPERVRERFPRDSMLGDMRAECYVGTPLFDASGRALGLIAVIGERPLADPPTAENVLRIFAARAATELERRRDRGVPAAR